MLTLNTHELKTWPEYFEPILTGAKRFEGRKDDRGFKIGDQLKLREWCPKSKDYTGRQIYCHITFILPGGQWGIEEGYCVLSIAGVTT